MKGVAVESAINYQISDALTSSRRKLRSIITSLVDKTRARYFEHLAHVYLPL